MASLCVVDGMVPEDEPHRGLLDEIEDLERRRRKRKAPKDDALDLGKIR